MQRLFKGMSLALMTMLVLAACSANTGSTPDVGDKEVEVIKVAASATPMTDVVLAAAESIEPGYEVQLVETSGYFTPNIILRDGEVDANFIQHKPHMQDFNEANNAKLEVVQPIYYVVGAFFSRNYDSLADLPDGAKLVIPNDSNEGRALELLRVEGLLELDSSVPEFAAQVSDITANPKGFKFTTVELMNLNVAYEEADVVFSLGSFARQIGLFPETDGLASEFDERFAVSLVTRAENIDSPKIAALKRAFTSEKVREVLEGLDQKVAF